MVDYQDPNTVASDYGLYALRLSQALATQLTGRLIQ